MSDANYGDWQASLALLQRGFTAQGWLEWVEHIHDMGTGVDFVQSMGIPFINLLFNRRMADTMLLAATQLPEAQAMAAFDEIVQVVREARFDRSSEAVPREFRRLYHESTSSVMRFLPDAAAVFHSMFTLYLRGDYDPDKDANYWMRASQRALEDRNRAGALEMIGRAGAAALRGLDLWQGWTHEGSLEFRQWALSLHSAVGDWEWLLPLEAADVERGRVPPRIGLEPEKGLLLATAAVGSGHETEDELDAEAPEHDETDLETVWMNLVSRDTPLTDEEIKALGGRYEMLVQLSLHALQKNMRGPDTDAASLGIKSLGLLRYRHPIAIEALIELIVVQSEIEAQRAFFDGLEEDEEMTMTMTMTIGRRTAIGDHNVDDYDYVVDDFEGEYDDDGFGAAGLAGDAVWALQQMGNAAVPAVLEFLRYSTNTVARHELLEVLGVAGRGSQEAFDYLAGEFDYIAWSNVKTALALPLARLRDPRAIPIIVDALRHPAVSDSDAWNLLDALEELGVTLYVNRDHLSVNIPDYGVIEGVLPDDWQSRQEREESAMDAGDEEDDFGPPEGDLEIVEDYGDVIYDSQGIPRCPDCGEEMHYEAGEWRHAPPPGSDKKVGRNDLCPCGSGKKYKHCHGKGL